LGIDYDIGTMRAEPQTAAVGYPYPVNPSPALYFFLQDGFNHRALTGSAGFSLTLTGFYADEYVTDI